MTPSPQRPYRSSLLRRLLYLLLLQNQVSSIQLRSHLRKSLWPVEQQEENPSGRQGDRTVPRIGYPEQGVLLCEWNPLYKPQTIITE